MHHGVKQSWRVTGRDHEAVTIWAQGIAQIAAKIVLSNDVCDQRKADRHARTARIGLPYRVNRVRADCGDTDLIHVAHDRPAPVGSTDVRSIVTASTRYRMVRRGRPREPGCSRPLD